jgi:ketosteroid isomerase-like protein
MDAMSDLWEHSDRASCVHPGWERLTGWGAISASFFALFQNGQPLQFILTGEQLTVDGDLAWVTCDENILSSEVGGTVAAMNLFRRHDGVWRMVIHHGSSVVPHA